jgi:hypothetical protein
LDEALAVGRYGDVSVFVARIAALHKPDGGPAVGQQTKPLFACSNPRTQKKKYEAQGRLSAPTDFEA